MATCAVSGDLLQPSYPITPLDKQLMAYSNGDPPKFSLWGSYTAVASGGSGASGVAGEDASGPPPNVWFLAFVFGSGMAKKDPEGGNVVTVTQADFAPMVDSAAPAAPRFDAIPTGFFNGAGTELPTGTATAPAANGLTGYVGWRSQWLVQGLAEHEGGIEAAAAGCAGIEVLPFGLAGRHGRRAAARHHLWETLRPRGCP